MTEPVGSYDEEGIACSPGQRTGVEANVRTG
jgi:hypothetical protein